MRIEFMRNVIGPATVVFAALLAACAQQPSRSARPPVEERSFPPAPAPPSTSVPKPKPKPKPAPPKPETKETETPPSPAEGIEPAKVGYYVDTLYGRLRELQKNGVLVERQGNDISVDVTQGFVDGCALFAPVAKALVEYRMTRVAVDVVAATDDDAGRRAAKTRTETIAACLTDAGVAARRITTSAVSGVSHEATTALRIEPVVRGP